MTHDDDPMVQLSQMPGDTESAPTEAEWVRNDWAIYWIAAIAVAMLLGGVLG